MRVDTQVVKQSFKWIVYSLLLVNFALYANWDWHAATHAMGPGGAAGEVVAGVCHDHRLCGMAGPDHPVRAGDVHSLR